VPPAREKIERGLVCLCGGRREGKKGNPTTTLEFNKKQIVMKLPGRSSRCEITQERRTVVKRKMIHGWGLKMGEREKNSGGELALKVLGGFHLTS